MKKNLRIILLIIFLIVIALPWIGSRLDFRLQTPPSICVFCDPQTISCQMFYENGRAMALLPHKPVLGGHVLILPKRHVESLEELSPEEMGDIERIVHKIDPLMKRLYRSTGSLFLEKNGAVAGQSVPHVHFHYLPRSKAQSQLSFILSFLSRPWFKPLSKREIEETVDWYRKEI